MLRFKLSGLTVFISTLLICTIGNPSFAYCEPRDKEYPTYAIVADSRSTEETSPQSDGGSATPDQAIFLKKLIELHDQAEKKYPEKADIHLSLAIIYQEMKLYKESIREYKKALKRDPKIVSAHLNLGLIYAETKNYKIAEENFDLALKLAPDNQLANYGLAELYIQQKKFLPAEKNLNKLIGLYPKFAKAHYSLGKDLAKLKRNIKRLFL
jgi:tetratricopeptide (TPR) repeat protein